MQAMPASATRPLRGRQQRNVPGFWGCIGFCAYLIILVWTVPMDPDSAGARGLKGQAMAIGALLLASAPFLPYLIGRVRNGIHGSSLVLYIFWAVMFGLAPFGMAPAMSIIYLALTVAVFVSLGGVWMASDRQRAWIVMAIVVSCLAFCLKGIFTYGLGVGRGVGAVVPNTIGAFALTAAILSFLIPGWWRWLIYAVSLWIIAYVSARGSLVALTCFISVNEAVRVIVHRRFARVVTLAGVVFLLGCIVTGAAILSPSFREAFARPVVETLALDSPERGIQSGLSGRVGGYYRFFDDVEKSLVTGIGFRASKFYASHNAILDLIREAGAVGSLIFFVFIVLRVTQLARVVLWTALPAREREVAGGVLAGTCALLMLALVEMQLLNVGFPIGATSLLFLAYQEPLPVREAVPARAFNSRRETHRTWPGNEPC